MNANLLSYGLVVCLGCACVTGARGGTEWITFADTNHHFRFQYPKSWAVCADTTIAEHYHSVFVALNSAGKKDFVVKNRSLGVARTVSATKLPRGAAYLDIGWVEGPPPLWRFGKGIVEMESRDLGAVLREAKEEPSDDGRWVRRYLSFKKWGRAWIIQAILRTPVNQESRQMLDQVLASFRFDSIPTGDEIWAIGEARKRLPPEADPDEFTQEGGSSVRYVSTVKDGGDVLVTFSKAEADQPKKTWRYRVTAAGKVELLASVVAPFPVPQKASATSVELVRKYLGLEMTNFVFGSSITNFPVTREPATNTYPDFVQSTPNPDDGATWYKSDATDAYEKRFPGRWLRLGFKDGRLVGIHVWMGTALADDEARRKLLADFEDDYVQLRKGAGITKGPLQDQHLRVRFHPLCSWVNPSYAGVRITPPAKD